MACYIIAGWKEISTKFLHQWISNLWCFNRILWGSISWATILLRVTPLLGEKKRLEKKIGSFFDLFPIYGVLNHSYGVEYHEPPYYCISHHCRVIRNIQLSKLNISTFVHMQTQIFISNYSSWRAPWIFLCFLQHYTFFLFVNQLFSSQDFSSSNVR